MMTETPCSSPTRPPTRSCAGPDVSTSDAPGHRHRAADAGLPRRPPVRAGPTSTRAGLCATCGPSTTRTSLPGGAAGPFFAGLRARDRRRGRPPSSASSPPTTCWPSSWSRWATRPSRDRQPAGPGAGQPPHPSGRSVPSCPTSTCRCAPPCRRGRRPLPHGWARAGRLPAVEPTGVTHAGAEPTGRRERRHRRRRGRHDPRGARRHHPRGRRRTASHPGAPAGAALRGRGDQPRRRLPAGGRRGPAVEAREARPRGRVHRRSPPSSGQYVWTGRPARAA